MSPEAVEIIKRHMHTYPEGHVGWISWPPSELINLYPLSHLHSPEVVEFIQYLWGVVQEEKRAVRTGIIPNTDWILP